MADEPLARVGKGDPITADWANAVADAINARGAIDPNANGTATPYGIMTPADVDTMMRAPDAQAMPFDAAIIREGSDGDALYMALPSGPEYVWLNGAPISPDSTQAVGTAQNAFVRLEAVTNGSARYAVLAFTPPDSTTTPPRPPFWKIAVSSSVSRPSWADPTAPLVLLAAYNIAADDTSGTDTAPGDVPSLLKGLVQYHRGEISLGGGGETPDSECASGTGGEPGQSIQRWTGDEGDENNGALEVYRFTDPSTLDPGGSSAQSMDYFDDIFEFVVRDKRATRRRIHYLKPSDILNGSFEVVTNVGIANGYFFVEKTTVFFVAKRFIMGAPVRTNLFAVTTCAN